LQAQGRGPGQDIWQRDGEGGRRGAHKRGEDRDRPDQGGPARAIEIARRTHRRDTAPPRRPRERDRRDRAGLGGCYFFGTRSWCVIGGFGGGLPGSVDGRAPLRSSSSPLPFKRSTI